MQNLKHLSQIEKRKWLVQEMQKKWFLDEDDIIDGDCKDNATVSIYGDIEFLDIFKILEQLDWQGFKIIEEGILIDIKIARNLIAGEINLASPKEFIISNGVMKILYNCCF